MGASDLFYGFVFGLSHLVPVGEQLRPYSLGNAGQRGKRTLNNLMPLVAETLDIHTAGCGVIVQLAYLTNVGNVQQFRDFRADLPGLRV